MVGFENMGLRIPDPSVVEQPEGIKIDTFLQKMYSPVRELTDELLRDSIKKYGLEKPLLVWKEENILVDGHRRLEACRELGITPTFEYKSFASRDDVILEMRLVQNMRRNLSDHERAVDTAKLLDSLRGNTDGEVAEVVAKATGQSVRSVHRRKKYVVSFDSLESGWKEFIVETGVPQKYVPMIAELPRAAQRAMLEACLEAGNHDLVRKRFADREKPPVKVEIRGGKLPKDLTPLPEFQEDDLLEGVTKKKERIEKLLEEAEKAGGVFHRMLGRLFGKEGLDSTGSYWKRRIDKAYREIGMVLQEVRDDQ
jgi:hypothetical protein